MRDAARSTPLYTARLALSLLFALLGLTCAQALPAQAASLLQRAPSMSALRAQLELRYLDRQYARTQPNLVSWHAGHCRRISRTADNCRERDIWAPGSNGMSVPNVCFTRVLLHTTSERMVVFNYGTTSCYSLERSKPQMIVIGPPPHPAGSVTQPFGRLGKRREARG